VVLSNDIKRIISGGTVTWKELKKGYMNRMTSILSDPPESDGNIFDVVYPSKKHLKSRQMQRSEKGGIVSITFAPVQ
jgi:hypothetical protein